jgi:hypothetical protein
MFILYFLPKIQLRVILGFLHNCVTVSSSGMGLLGSLRPPNLEDQGPHIWPLHFYLSARVALSTRDFSKNVLITAGPGTS